MKYALKVTVAIITSVIGLATTMWWAITRYEHAAHPVAASSREMINVPGGRYVIGSEVRHEKESTLRARAVTVAPFAIDQNPASAKDFLRLGVKFGATDRAGRVVGLSYAQAQRYCQVQRKRLPSEVEWEVAGHGRDRRPFPWGGAPGVVSLAQDVSQFGVRAMATGVGEWTTAVVFAIAPTAAVVHGHVHATTATLVASRLIADRNDPSIVQRMGVRCAADEVAR